MNALLRKTTAVLFGPASFPFFLLAMCLAAYGPFLPWLGFYWDDYPMSWIAASMGGEGLARYFATNRPVWGLLYQITTPILGSTPLAWQIAALLLRWASGLALWALLRQVWPDRRMFAAWAALLFVLYPGFGQQPIAFLYSHFFIILVLFLLSLLLSLLAVRHPHRFWPLTLAALLTGGYQMLAMEYFLLLEALRPLLLWLVIRQDGARQSPARQARRVLALWLPYLALLAGVMIWRTFFFGFHTYQPTLMSRLRQAPLPALLELAQTALRDVGLVTYGAWARAIQPPFLATLAAHQIQRYALAVAAAGLAALLYLLLFRPGGRAERGWLWQPLLVGVAALFIAGGPFWLTDLPLSLVFPNDRFTLSFMLGASLVLAALLHALPKPHISGAALLAAALGLAVGLHFQNGAAYRDDWRAQRSFFWQLVWRAPDLAPGTVLLSNELPLGPYTDNSLSAPLNWIYDPHNDPQRMNYILYYPTLRAASETWMVSQEKGQPIQRDYLATTFYGSTSQVITLYFEPPGCLRVLDPEIDTVNWMTPGVLRDTLALSSTAPILPAPQEGKAAPQPPAHLFGSEPAHNWCYYFQKAELARQQKDWQAVADLAELAFASGDYPNDPAERLPFIEGYAHLGDWQSALDLSRQARAITPVMQPVLCRLWQRIERETPAADEQQAALQTIRAELDCAP